MEKLPTGIGGLDAILQGGYPLGHPTLLKGGPGSGKTIFCQLFAAQCLAAGWHVSFITCDEPPSMLIKNMDAYGFQASKAVDEDKLSMLDFCPNFSDQFVGEFELEAILLRVQTSFPGPKNILIIDSLQNLFMGLETENHTISLFKLLSWCREQNITLLCTGADNLGTGYDESFEEYASDCVILINQQVTEKLMTRYLRVLKYRGTGHGTNEYPFLLTQKGVSLFPITDVSLEKQQSSKRFSTGINKLDHMLGGGLIESSSIMISGSSGTAKSLISATISAKFSSDSIKTLHLSYEESAFKYIQNVKSIGIDLEPLVKNKSLFLKSTRSVELGLEEHLISIINLVDELQPGLLVIDPITSLLDMGTSTEVKSLLVRFISYLKNRNITLVLTELLKEENNYRSIIGLSSLADTWIKLKQVESNGEFNRTVSIMKSRGSKTSRQIKEFKITNDGIRIENPYLGAGGMVFGSEKDERKMLDEQKHALLNKQLDEINSQIAIINKDKNLEKVEFKFALLEKKNKIEMALKDLNAISVLNKKLRDV